MKLTPEQMIDRAATFGARVHAHQTRKDGTPYFAHCVRVAIRVPDKITGTIALLHDTVEDTDTTLDDLRDLGFSNEVVEAVDCLSRRPGETYANFIERAAVNEHARIVKIADIQDNLQDQSALDPDEAEFLKKRYTKALKRLERK